MSKWPLVACLVVTAFPLGGCAAPWAAEAAPPPPTFTIFRRQALYDGHGIALSVVGPSIQPSDIERIAEKERRVLVRVLVYTPGQTIGTEKPAALWEHTESQGLTQIY